MLDLPSEISGLTRTNQRVALAGKYESRLNNLGEAVGERAFAQRCEEREQHACLHLGHAALSPSQRPQEATTVLMRDTTAEFRKRPRDQPSNAQGSLADARVSE